MKQKPKCPHHPNAPYYIQDNKVYCVDCNTLIQKVKKTSGKKQFNTSYVLKSGKHAGKTILQAVQDDPKWAKWCSQNLDNDFIKKSIKKAMRQ